MTFPRPLRARKAVDYRSAGLGAADEPSWLKLSVSGTSPETITTPKDHASDKRDVENLNPQVKRKTPPNSAKSGRKDNKPGVLSSKLPDQTSGGKKPTTRSSVSHGSGSGSAEKPSSSAKEVARISTTGKENTQHKGPAKPADAADSPVRPSKRPRGWKEDSETGGKQGEAMNKQKSTLQKRRSGSANASPDEPPPRTRHGSSSGRAPSKDVPAAAEPREEDDDDVIIVEAKEGKKDTAEKKKSGSCKGKQTEAGHTQRKTQGRKLACRGRDAGLVIEDMDETVIKAAEASLEKGTMKIVPAPPSEEERPIHQQLRPVRGLPGVAQLVSAPTAVRPRASVEEQDAPPSWIHSAFDAQEASPLPQMPRPPSPLRQQDQVPSRRESQERATNLLLPASAAGLISSAAFQSLQEAYVSLQEKYCALKDGTLKELEAKLKNSKEHMDKFKCAAMRLASHWKEEAERQALMVQSACGAEMEDELRRLKAESAVMQRANVELLAQLEEARINVRIAEHAAEAANLRAAAAEESLTSLLAKETAEAATQAEVALPAATALVEYGSSEGSHAHNSRTEIPPVTETPVPEKCLEGNGMDDVLSDKARTAAMSVSAEDGEEEELVILEICINSGDQGSVSTPVAASKLPPPSTPCSLIRRLGCQDDLLAGRPASGPVRVVLNTRPDLGREAEPAIRKGLDELVAQAQAALLEATPVLKRAAGDLHKSPVRTLTLSAGDIERPKVDAADEETVGKTAEDGSGPLEPLEGFTCREGSKLGFATYEHNATGFSFEIGPASPISDDPEELGECGEGTGRDMIYRPLGLGRAAGVIPNWLQQSDPPVDFKESLKHKLFEKILENLDGLRGPKRRRNA